MDKQFLLHDLYRATSRLMAELGCEGQITTDNPLVDHVLNILQEIDGGDAAHQYQGFTKTAYISGITASVLRRGGSACDVLFTPVQTERNRVRVLIDASDVGD